MSLLAWAGRVTTDHTQRTHGLEQQTRRQKTGGRGGRKASTLQLRARGRRALRMRTWITDRPALRHELRWRSPLLRRTLGVGQRDAVPRTRVARWAE